MLEDRNSGQSNTQNTSNNRSTQPGEPIIPPATSGRVDNTGQYSRPDTNYSQSAYQPEFYSIQPANRTRINPYLSPADGGYISPAGTTYPYQMGATGEKPGNPYNLPGGTFGLEYHTQLQPELVPSAPVYQPVVKQEKANKRASLFLAVTGVFLFGILVLLATLLLTSQSNQNTQTAAIVPSGSTFTNPPTAAPTRTATPSNTTAAAAAQQPAVVGSLLSVREVAEKVKPAVVQVSNLQKAAAGFGSGTGRQGSNGQTGSEPIEAGVGSGIIYDKAGYILTNNHVITGSDALLVTLPDGRTFNATIVGQDQLTDLAVIKIDPKDGIIPVATLGDSSQLRVGDGLVAIGNALALPGGPTVTYGVVSALDRSVTEPAAEGGSASTSASGPTLYGLIQTDAAINPGNSGGPLIDLKGEVVGINTLGAGQAEAGVQAQGIGFAISINQAKDIAQQLVANGKVSHAYMGISYQPLTPAKASQLGVTLKAGALLTTVQAATPAAQAGLKPGDIITSIDGKQLTGESALGQILNGHQPGDKITLQVISPQLSGGNGQSRSVEITLGQRP